MARRREMNWIIKRQGESWKRGLEFSLIIMCMVVFATFSIITCMDDSGGGDHDSVSSSRAYKGHEGDVDINNFCQAYPDMVGTRLDDCQTCHRSGTVIHVDDGEIFKNACDYCHLYVHPDPDIISGGPESYRETLNPYGIDYMDYGRDKYALWEIQSLDSDEDSFNNVEEIKDIRYPGDPDSKPGQPMIPLKFLSMKEIKAMASHEHLQLNNSKRHKFDDYVYYKGISIKDLLAAIGTDMTGVTGISVIAPDGFVKDFTIDKVNNKYPDGLYYPGLDTGTLGEECGFVNYPPEEYTSGLGYGDTIPDQWLMLAYLRDGVPMEPCYLDPTTGQIEGEGPYRIIVPQDPSGAPDRGSTYSPTCGDGFDYDSSKDHNAGAMVRGVIAIRVNPMPAGYEEFDYMNGGWAYIDTEELIIYGKGVLNP